MKKRTKEKLHEVAIKLQAMIILSALFLGIYTLMQGTELYNIGFHNTDLGWNFENIGIQFGTDFYDIGSDFVIRNTTQMIIMGHNQQRLAIKKIFLGTWLIGFTMAWAAALIIFLGSRR